MSDVWKLGGRFGIFLCVLLFNFSTRSIFSPRQRDDLKRKTSILRKINPSNCNFKVIGNQNLFLHWGIFAENFPEEILQKLHSKNNGTIEIRRSYLYKEQLAFNTLRIGLGHKPLHLINFHDVPDSTYIYVKRFIRTLFCPGIFQKTDLKIISILIWK